MPDATQSTVTGLQWFKIYEDGLTVSTGQWAVDRLIANKGKVSFTIPSCIQSGQYLLRHEIIGASSALPSLFCAGGRKLMRLRMRSDVIALYHASKYPGAEFYVECAQLNVIGGSGDEDPESTVQFPGAYKASDPGE